MAYLGSIVEKKLLEMKTYYPPENYTSALPFLEVLRKYRRKLPSDTLSKIRDKAISGDIPEAQKLLRQEIDKKWEAK